MKYNLNWLKEKYNVCEHLNYVFFWSGEKTRKLNKNCLSQWYMADFIIDGVTYCCCEQYMMSEKAKLFNDMEIYNKILACAEPKEIKKYGRLVKGFDPETWEEHCLEIVKRANIEKFSQNKELADFLISTNDSILVEASPYDKIWGIGMYAGDHAMNPYNWKGTNYLGFTLMEVRYLLTHTSE